MKERIGPQLDLYEIFTVQRTRIEKLSVLLIIVLLIGSSAAAVLLMETWF
jgi:hypothetical protein